MRQPFLRKQTNTWYVWVGSKCMRLSKDRDEAFKLWHEMMSRKTPLTSDTTVNQIVNRFMDWCERNRSQSTSEWYRLYLTNFAKHLGHLTVRELKPGHVEDWVQEQYGACSDNGRNGAVRAVVRPFNWAVKRGDIDKNPIVGVERPQPQSRDVYVQPEDWDRLIAWVKDNVKDETTLNMLTILRETGCRPHEARIVEARHVDRNLRAWVFSPEESKGKRRRTVLLNDAAWELTQKLMLKNPAGPLFRNSRGNAWTNSALTHRFRAIGKRVGIKLTPYYLRHSYVTNALCNGVDPVTVSTIVGHRSLDMIQRVYAHLQHRSDHMRSALERAVS